MIVQTAHDRFPGEDRILKSAGGMSGLACDVAGSLCGERSQRIIAVQSEIGKN